MGSNSAISAMVDRRAMLRSAGALGLASMLPAEANASASFDGASEIQALIDNRVAEKQLPGAIVSLGMGTARPGLVMGGTLDLDSPVPVNEDTLWRLASMTKPIAGMAAMLLVSEGKLRLDQPVADFIPGFADMRVISDPKSADSRPAARLITIRHLITHTSGIVNDPVGTIAESYRQLGLAGEPLPESGGVSTGRSLPPPRTLEEYADRLAQVPLTADPGAKWIYSPNLDIAARIIEIVSRLPFDIFLERRVFLPLGMRSTYFWVPERDKGRLMTSYVRRDGKLVAIDVGMTSRLLTKPAFPRASGGLVSSASDYDRFLSMIVNQGLLDRRRVFPADAVAIGTSNLLPSGTDMSQYTSKTGFDGFGAGGMVTVGGPRPGTYGWGGSSGTTGFANPQLKSRWISFTNIGASDFGRRAMAAAGMTFSQANMPGGAESSVAPQAR
jgi:CubicO group peptidase (beta-lactamase class C family)